MTWNEYKKKILPSIKDYKEQQINIYYTGLASEIGELMKCDCEDFKNGKVDNTSRQMEIGDVLWFIAALEIFYKLPDTVHENIMNFEIKAENIDTLKWVSAGDLYNAMSELIMSMHAFDLAEIQYDLNKLFGALIDYAVSYNIQLVNCLTASLVKLDLRKEGKKSHTKEYSSVKKAISNSGKDELLLEPVIVKNEYTALNILFKGEVFNFNSGDIIIDFFKAMNYIDNDIKGGFTMNYGPKFRKLLKDNTSICNGFIIGENLVKPQDLTNKNIKGNTLIVQGRKPSIFRSDMTKLNDLLDYINEHKKQDA
jgi:hypothetical protein